MTEETPAITLDIQDLVEINIKPVLDIDTDLSSDIPSVILAQIAIMGFAGEDDLTDKQKVYIAALTLEALIPRLALIYTEEVQEHRTGPETIKLPPRSDFFKSLQKAIDNMKTTAGRPFGDYSQSAKAAKPWPGCGIVRWGRRHHR